MPHQSRLADFEGLPVIWTRSARRTIGLVLHAEGWLEIRSPAGHSERQVTAFLRSRTDWIRRAVIRCGNCVWVERDRPDPGEQHRFRREVERLATMFAENLPGANRSYRIAFRSQRSRWGSCSASGTISVNYACSRLPTRLLEYIVAHELCHLVHMNHGTAFHALLNRLIPDGQLRKKELTRYRIHQDSAVLHPLG
jgi:predicted metal-dependent hydrolase